MKKVVLEENLEGYLRKLDQNRNKITERLKELSEEISDQNMIINALNGQKIKILQDYVRQHKLEGQFKLNDQYILEITPIPVQQEKATQEGNLSDEEE